MTTSDLTADWHLREVAPELVRGYRAEGWWTDETLGTTLAGHLAAGRDLTFRVRSRVRPWHGTMGDVDDLARRLATGLQARGIGPGDVVAFQIPNWVEAAATFYATAYLGAVLVPIVHFYGPKEVGYILRRSQARLFITADRFGVQDHLANLEQVRGDLPALEHVVVVAADEASPAVPGTTPFSSLVDGAPIEGPVPVDPSGPALVAYTSGTTADPKGVVHSHRTIGCEVRQLGAVQPPDQRPALWGMPVSHAGGMLGALLLPLGRGHPIHLTDVWDPGQVLAGMLEDDLASGSGATFFLTSLLDHPDLTPRHLELMHYVGMGGAAIPPAVAERATALGLSITRMYGSTEHPSITGATHDLPVEKRNHTDGRTMPGVEVRLVDDDGNDVTPGQPGEILSRGPDCFMGYTDPALTAAAFRPGGWYATEDVGVFDDEGYLTIVDRKKDIIIRGGENVSAAEVEEQLLRLPGVAEAAVVAGPDERLGERVCALLRLLPGAQPPDLDAVQAHVRAAGLARQKWPELVTIVDDFPRTPSGKVQKAVLRTRLSASQP